MEFDRNISRNEILPDNLLDKNITDLIRLFKLRLFGPGATGIELLPLKSSIPDEIKNDHVNLSEFEIKKGSLLIKNTCRYRHILTDRQAFISISDNKSKRRLISSRNFLYIKERRIDTQQPIDNSLGAIIEARRLINDLPPREKLIFTVKP